MCHLREECDLKAQLQVMLGPPVYILAPHFPQTYTSGLLKLLDALTFCPVRVVEQSSRA